LQAIQLLHTVLQVRQELRDPEMSMARPFLLAVHAIGGRLHLSGVLRLSGCGVSNSGRGVIAS